MVAKEFIRKVRRHARAQGLTVGLDLKRGKGGHIRVILGDRAASVPTGSKGFRRGLLRSLLQSLGIGRKNF